MGVSSGGVSNYVNTSSGVAIGVCADNGVSGGGVYVDIGFSPLSLFADGAFGFWHDYTDPTTWFQDTAGTTPATALGDPVGRVNDKSGNGITGLQATSAARPTYGRMPFGGVRNQITFSEDLTNAAWTKLRVTAASATNIVETITLDSHAISTPFVSTSGSEYTTTVTLEKGVLATAPTFMEILYSTNGFGSVQYAIVNVETGAVVSTAGGATCTSAADPLTPSGFRFSYTATATSSASASFFVAFCDNNSTAVRAPVYAGLITSDCSVYRTQVERGATATAYQKVVQAYDVTESGVASVDCLWFDGVDDFLELTAAGAGLVRNTGRFTEFASGLHTKALTSTQAQFAATMSASAATRASIGGTATNFTYVQARRTAADAYAPLLEFAAFPFIPYIRTGVLSYATGLGELRVDGVLVDSDATFFTVGNTEDSDSQNIYVARASAAYFGGFMTGVITVKATALSESQLLQTEQYLGNQIGVTI